MITEDKVFTPLKETPEIFIIINEFNKNFNAQLDKNSFSHHVILPADYS
ncbi:hypothetical protein [Prevotella koreensis]